MPIIHIQGRKIQLVMLFVDLPMTIKQANGSHSGMNMMVKLKLVTVQSLKQLAFKTMSKGTENSMNA